MSDEDKVAELRKLIPATGAGIYLDTAYRGPMPAETAAAMHEADEWELRVGRATEGRQEDMAQRIEEARAVIAALIGADPSEIVLTAGVEVAMELARRISHPNTLWEGAADSSLGIGRNIPDKLDWWFATDASLAVGAVEITASTFDSEFVIFAADKWLLGPEETAAMWLSPKARERAPDLAASYGLSRTAVLGLARSIGWLEMYVGLEWAFQRTAALAAQLRDRLGAIEYVFVATPREQLGAIVLFSVGLWESEQVLEELRRRVFAIVGSVHTPDPRDTASIRASVAWFNTEEEIDRFAAAVAEIASYTPETLPRRPRLVVQ
jgi:selenocysteine lyase/cysteine desulfurase